MRVQGQEVRAGGGLQPVSLGMTWRTSEPTGVPRQERGLCAVAHEGRPCFTEGRA